MGYYIQTSSPRNKAKDIAAIYNGEVLYYPPPKFSDIPEGKALIAVVHNAAFEAAAYVYSQSELECFTDPRDMRFKEFVYIDKEAAEIASGYKKQETSDV